MYKNGHFNSLEYSIRLKLAQHGYTSSELGLFLPCNDTINGKIRIHLDRNPICTFIVIIL